MLFKGKRLLLAIGLLYSQLLLAHTSDEQCHSIKVSTHPNYPPFHYTRDEQLVGPSIELAQRLAIDMGIHLEVQPPMPWKRVLMEGKKGNVDMIVGLKDTPERKKYLNFSSVPVFANPMSIFVKTPKAREIDSWLDLLKFDGAISAGDKFGDEFDRFSLQFLKFEVAPNPNSLVQMLLKDRIDYIVLGKETGKQMLTELEVKANEIQPVVTINTGLVYLAFSKKSPCARLLRQVDSKLLQYLRQQNQRDHG